PGSTSLADYMSGMYGAIGALVALKARDTTGVGQCVDLALYESVFRVLDEIAPAYQKFGYVRERMGADTVARPGLPSVERVGPQQLRLAAREEVNKIVAKWVVSFDCETILVRCAD